jgi:hypothetical protein
MLVVVQTAVMDHQGYPVRQMLDGIPVVRGPCGHADIIDDDKMDYADANARKA